MAPKVRRTNTNALPNIKTVNHFDYYLSLNKKLLSIVNQKGTEPHPEPANFYNPNKLTHPYNMDAQVKYPSPQSFNRSNKNIFPDLRTNNLINKGKKTTMQNRIHVYRSSNVDKTKQGATALPMSRKTKGTASFKSFPTSPNAKPNINNAKLHTRLTMLPQHKPILGRKGNPASQSARQYFRKSTLKTNFRPTLPLPKLHSSKKNILNKSANGSFGPQHNKHLTHNPEPKQTLAIPITVTAQKIMSNNRRGGNLLLKPSLDIRPFAQVTGNKKHLAKMAPLTKPQINSLSQKQRSNRKKSRILSKGSAHNIPLSKTPEQRKEAESEYLHPLLNLSAKDPANIPTLISPVTRFVSISNSKSTFSTENTVQDCIADKPLHTQAPDLSPIKEGTYGNIYSTQSSTTPNINKITMNWFPPPKNANVDNSAFSVGRLAEISKGVETNVSQKPLLEMSPPDDKKPELSISHKNEQSGILKVPSKPERTLADIRETLTSLVFQTKSKDSESNSETSKSGGSKGSTGSHSGSTGQELRRKVLNNNGNNSKARQVISIATNANYSQGGDNYNMLKSYVSKQQFNMLRDKTAAAIRDQRTFAVIGGRSYGIETALKKRGWIQKFADSDGNKYLPGRVTRAPDPQTFVISQLMGKAHIKFLWAIGYCNWGFVSPGTIVNRFPYTYNSCTTKVGLCRVLQDQYWTHRAGHPLVQYPRTFECHSNEDLRHFAGNYRINACASLVKLFLETTNTNLCGFISDNGKVPLEALDFAIQRLCEFVSFKEHADIDVWNVSVVTESEWSLFLQRYYDIAHNNEHFKTSSNLNILALIEACKTCVNTVKPYFPNMETEGYKNVWIIKPGASGRGRGIVLQKTLKGILDFCKSRNHYVVQKYIERPLLIYNTKFDIRQWVLVTSLYPLVIWMYNDCYLRFSTQKFSLANLHESVHLCNNAIQTKYKNCERSKDLPDENMWDSSTFLNYLSLQGIEDKWFSVVVPRMEEAIVGTLLASQDRMSQRANSFTLYGADFMLSEDYSPWLIEINSQPDMCHTTSVTRRMCPEALDDVCKVVIDRRTNEKANTGKFRIIFKQKVSPLSAGPLPSFMIIGKRMRLYRAPRVNHRYGQRKVVKDETENSVTWRSLKYEKISNYKLDLRGHISKALPPTSSWIMKEECDKRPLGPGEIFPTESVSLEIVNSPSSNTEDIGQKYLSMNDMKAMEHKNLME